METVEAMVPYDDPEDYPGDATERSVKAS